MSVDNKIKKPELLAPAGDMASFKAALANGADAVYIGGRAFSARAQAGNFSDEELLCAVKNAHFHGMKVYCAVNTLISDRELPTALDYVKFLSDAGIDAVIVQDYGLFKAIKSLFPALPVNVSTQMTVHNADGARFMEREGANRIILSRELGLKDIKTICDETECETEVFVHGALCVCYSGQCLMSSMIGGRSGNRGRCAQPCRLPYALCDAAGNKVGEGIGEYLLSPKDLFGINAIDGLLETKVDSLKIEGRMKRPEYVAVVAKNYHELLEAKAEGKEFDTDRAMADLKQIFNRDHWTGYLESNPAGSLCSGKKPNNRGVFLGRVVSSTKSKIVLQCDIPLRAGDGLEIWVTKGGRSGFLAEDMRIKGERVDYAAAGSRVELNFAGAAYPGDRVFKTNDSALMSSAEESMRHEPTLPLTMHLQAHLGGNVKLSASDMRGESRTAADDSYTVVKAEKRVADEVYIRGQLERLGGSGYYLEKLTLDIDEGIMLPASVLNNLRRECTEALQEYYENKRSYPAVSEKVYAAGKAALLKNGKASLHRKNPLLAALCASESAAIAAADGADIIYLENALFERKVPDTDYRALRAKIAAKGAELIPVLPQIYLQSERNYWLRQIDAWIDAGIESIRCDSLGAVELVHEAGFDGKLCGGVGLNIFNSLTAERFFEHGLSRLLLSSELNLSQLEALHYSGEKELLIHGASQLMISEYCALGAALGGRTAEKPCSMPCREANNYTLKDQKGFNFPVRCDRFCRMHIYNARELCMINDIAALKKAGVDIVLLDLRLYRPNAAAEVASLYRSALQGADGEMLLTQMKKYCPQGFTKGHFYRGVCDGQ